MSRKTSTDAAPTCKGAIKRELDTLQKSHGGLLKAEDIVRFAKNPRTALHGRFTWDNTEAGKKWRLHEARMLLHVYVTVTQESVQPVQMYISLPTDRKQPGGGYRTYESICQSPERYGVLLASALADLRRVQAKYRTLKELQPVFEAVDRVEQKASKTDARVSGHRTAAALSA
jgi:hypothetical protein